MSRLMNYDEASRHIGWAALTNGIERHEEFHRMEELAGKIYDEYFVDKENRINFATFISALVLTYARIFAQDDPEKSKPAEA